jgi:hypothetical protein
LASSNWNGRINMTAHQQRALVTALIGLGLLIVGFFGLRTIHAFREFHGHRPPPRPFKNEQPATDVELIRDWMTIALIGRMYQVPPSVIFDALNIPPVGNEKKSLKQLNDKYFSNEPGHVLEVVKATVQANLPPTAIPADTAIPPATAVPPVSP